MLLSLTCHYYRDVSEKRKARKGDSGLTGPVDIPEVLLEKLGFPRKRQFQKVSTAGRDMGCLLAGGACKGTALPVVIALHSNGENSPCHTWFLLHHNCQVFAAINQSIPPSLRPPQVESLSGGEPRRSFSPPC
jgi:hypothetical protein